MTKIQCILHTVQCTLNRIQRTVYTVQYTGVTAAGLQTDCQRQLLAAFCVFAVAPIRNKVQSVL